MSNLRSCLGIQTPTHKVFGRLGKIYATHATRTEGLVQFQQQFLEPRGVPLMRCFGVNSCLTSHDRLKIGPPKVAFYIKEGKFLGKSRLVKYYSIWPHVFFIYLHLGSLGDQCL